MFYFLGLLSKLITRELTLNFPSLPAHQDDPGAPEAELGGGLEAEAGGSPSDYHSFPNKAGETKSMIDIILLGIRRITLTCYCTEGLS